MIVYLAGPMSGYPLWNFPAFDEAAEQLRAAGYTVTSPAELDRNRGFDESAPVESFTSADRYRALRHDLHMILWATDAVVTLPGSLESEGARLEASVARGVGLPVYTLSEALSKGPY